ncbi:hypothetical protein GCM10023116_10170 [Kistimonas scapharcae]|uniref:Uncharacterized protein n=1 Tax=Kistimonas scapharcae TaxID=1036133 RepID=A0ABP8UYC6_9GAMM
MSDMEERLIQAERDIAVMDHRVRDLETTPPRINTLENTVTHLQIKVETMSSDIAEIKSEAKETHLLVVKLGDDVKRLFMVGVAVVVLITGIAGSLRMYDTWLDIQTKTTQDAQHAGVTHQGLQEL